MYTLIFSILDVKYNAEQEKLKDLLSVCVDIFNKNGQFINIQKDGKIIYESCEIYKLIKKAVY